VPCPRRLCAPAVLDAVQELGHVGAGPVGYWGVSLGCGLGVPFVAAEPRVRAAVLGLGGALASAGAAATAGITRWLAAPPSRHRTHTAGGAPGADGGPS
jgi:dienelactone hydrolase